MNIAVFGAGYVGIVTAACLAGFGHRIWLVEISPEKLQMLRSGICPISEPGLQEALGEALQSGQVIPVAIATEAIAKTELSMVCVGTPGRGSGEPETHQLRTVLKDIAVETRQNRGHNVIVLRSTITALQLTDEIIPLLKEVLGKGFGRDVFFAVNPEFLREGKAMEDFKKPPFIIVGTDHPPAADTLLRIHRAIDAPFYIVSPGTASLLKYASNAFHALKVAFANEIASLESVFGADGDMVMKLFCLDHSLNISPAYLRPGFAFGGSCLPKDLRALNQVALAVGIPCPVIDSVLRSNEVVIQRSVEAIARLCVSNITLVGLSFKSQTDDLRESPMVELAERLLGKGYQLRIYDPDVRAGMLKGKNLQYVKKHLGHLASLLTEEVGAAIADAQLIVIGKPIVTLDRFMDHCTPDLKILDLIHYFPMNSDRPNLFRVAGETYGL